MKQQLILYAEELSPRLRYISQVIFEQQFGWKVIYTSDAAFFQQTQGLHCCYHEASISGTEWHIKPVGLLAETNIRACTMQVIQWHHLPAFFPVTGGDLPFDILSASFYLLSRYEEYLPVETDLHGRYPHTASLAWQHQFLSKPLVDLWALQVKEELRLKFPTLTFQSNTARFVPTYDIDIAYSYLGKPWLLQIGGGLRDIIRADLKRLRMRMQVLQKKRSDPYDAYDWLHDLHHSCQVTPLYFMLIGPPHPFNKNLSVTHPLMQALLHRLKQEGPLGLHPSYDTMHHPDILQHELHQLPARISRQHYIRFALPQTFRALLQAGIEADYSMGYGSINGFRASTSFPFPWFDLEKNECTTLMLYPFCFMECNSFFEQRQSLEATKKELDQLQQQVGNVGGVLISIWHNFSLGTDLQWQGWRDMYATWMRNLPQGGFALT